MGDAIYRVAELHERGWLLVEDGNHGEYRPRPTEFGTGEYRFIRAADMDRGTVLFDKADRINAVARNRIRKGVGAPGDILFSHKGTVGKIALVPDDAPLFVCSPQTTFWRTLDQEKIDRRYLYYFMQSPEFTAQWESRKDETDMAAYVSLTAQRELVVRLPDIESQRQVGRVLGALDDKIELNGRNSRALSALSDALFKSWFIDFDPVQALRDGRTPLGVPDAALRLMPREFENSEIGPIPKGWEVIRLRDCGSWVSGGTPARANPKFWNGDIPWISAKSLHAFFLEDSADQVTREGALAGSRLVPKGTVLFLVRGMSLAEEFRFGIAARELTFNQDTKAVVPRADLNGILLALLLRHETETILGLVDEATHGTKRLQTELVENLRLVVPPAGALRDALTAPLALMAEKQLSNQRNTRTLENLRDAILAPLVSGDLTISQAARISDVG